MRIHIIGLPGSGKSTLARELGGRTGGNVYSLDALSYNPRTDKRRPLDQIAPRLAAVAAEEVWITEGIYTDGWIEPLLSAADLIIRLDLPLLICCTRIVRRYYLQTPRPDRRGLLPLVMDLGFTCRLWLSQSSPTDALLRPYAQRVRRCRTRADIEALTFSISQWH